MKPATAPKESSLLELTLELSAALDRLRPLEPQVRDEARAAALLTLRAKLIPELRHGLGLPVFIGVQGGTNTGKSTVFNALAGKLLSPALVQASTTKHPLLYAHSRWKDTLLSDAMLPGVEMRELEDPRELIVDAERTDTVYVHFHDDPRLEAIALIDSPDFDSALESNARQALRIATLSDATLFVTTMQKYRDRALVEHLRALLAQKSKVILIFNLVDEDVVFETLLDDLRNLTLPEGRQVRALRIAASALKHPEEELGPLLRSQALGELDELRPDAVKPITVGRAFEALQAMLEDVLAQYRREVSFKAEIAKFARDRTALLAEEYARGERLAFPERTIAIQRAIALTELGGILFPEDGEGAWPFRLLSRCVGKLNDTVRRAYIRCAGRYEGSVDAEPEALIEYARNRDRADSDAVLRLAERLRVQVEALVREREERSSLARGLVRELFSAAFTADLSARVREIHARELQADGWSESEWLARAQERIRSHPRTARAIRAAAIGLKLACGVAAAWLLPPAKGLWTILSPLKWLYFIGGYFAGAWIVAFAACCLLDRRRRFDARRRGAALRTLEAAFLSPLFRAMDEAVSEPDVQRIGVLSDSLAKHPELKALDRIRPASGDGSGGSA